MIFLGCKKCSVFIVHLLFIWGLPSHISLLPPPYRSQLLHSSQVNFIILISYFLYLHFKCYAFTWFHLQKLPILSPLPMLINPPTPTSWPWHSPTLGHRAFIGPRASPPIDDRLGYPLLHMQLEPWVPPCVLFGLWFSAWEGILILKSMFPIPKRHRTQML